MPPSPIGVGVIGCGSVSRVYVPHLQRLNVPRQRVDIRLCCDANPAREEVVRDRYNIESFTTDYRQVLERDDIDLVLVLTSMPRHYEIARAALEAGKHVLVEKPMAMTLPEAAELVEIAKTSRGFLMPAPHVVLSPTYQAMWRRIHMGQIGRPLSARGFYGWAGPDWGPWFYQKGGGAMFDLGVYNVTSLTGLLGPAKRIVALSGIAIPERIVDGKMQKVETHDNAHLLLDWGNGTYASITTGFTIQKYDVPGLEIYGTDGVLYMDGEDWAPRGYRLWENSKGCWQDFEDTSSWPWSDGIRHFVDCIESGTAPLVTPEHAYHVLEIMLKSMESGDTGRAIEIESTFTPPTFADADLLDHGAHLVHAPGTGSGE
jgi:predicted dehydrogenase